MEIYFMSEDSDNGNCAGTKARNDLEKIFLKMGFVKFGKQLQRKEKRTLSYFIRNYFAANNVKHNISKIKNEAVFFQYPITKSVLLENSLKKCAKKNKLIFFIHDLNYLRTDAEVGKREEIEFLNCAHALICHNSKMIDKLVGDGVTVKNLINLELFDYLLDDEGACKPIYGREVVYAGNLKKGGFLDELQRNEDRFQFGLHLYGINFEGNSTDKIKFEGSFSPEKLVEELNYSYGLIWDSTVANTCDGVLGNYTKYNNPHKCSLYAAAGLPIIAWSKSAIADFVREKEIGFTVDSLYDIDEKLNEITPEKYHLFISNLADIQEKVRKGIFAVSAIQKAIDTL